MVLETIVVGYDGTTPAQRAIEHAAALAEAFGAAIVVVDVAPPVPLQGMPGAFGFMPYYAEPAVQEGATNETLWRQHRASIEALLAEGGVSHEFAGSIGEPVQEIVDAADRHAADLIVVGTREPGFLERLLEGSVSQGVARRAHCDVLIVHDAER